MKKAILILAMIITMASAACAEVALPPGLALSPVNLHSLSTGQNIVAGELSMQVGSVKGIPLNIGVLVATDSNGEDTWGLNASATIAKRIRLGIGGISEETGPCLTLSFQVL